VYKDKVGLYEVTGWADRQETNEAALAREKNGCPDYTLSKKGQLALQLFLKGAELRPKTIRGPLRVQCSGRGDPNPLRHIIQEVMDGPQIESTAPFVGYQDTVSIRVRETACTDNASAFLSGRECARVLLQAPTIYLALPLVCAQLQLYFRKRVCLKDRE
jgi:hypothetical protein